MYFLINIKSHCVCIDCFYGLRTRIYEYVPPPPNYRASYGPAILSYFLAIRQVLKNMLVAKQRPELSCRRHWGGVLFAIIVPFVILVKNCASWTIIYWYDLYGRRGPSDWRFRQCYQIIQYPFSVDKKFLTIFSLIFLILFFELLAWSIYIVLKVRYCTCCLLMMLIFLDFIEVILGLV